MRRRALLAAALTGVLTAVAGIVDRDTRARPVERLYATRHEGPARQAPWHPGARRPQAPAWLYENGLTPYEQAIAATTPCACASERRPLQWPTTAPTT